MLGYLTIVSTAVAGLIGASWWAAIVGGCLLALMSITNQRKFQARYDMNTVIDVLTISTVISLMNGCLAGGAAYLLGRASGLLWGI